MSRRIGHLDTPDKCRQECAKVYRLACKGEIAWQDAHERAVYLTRLINVDGGTEKQAEVNWSDVGKNAIHR